MAVDATQLQLKVCDFVKRREYSRTEGTEWHAYGVKIKSSGRKASLCERCVKLLSAATAAKKKKQRSQSFLGFAPIPLLHTRAVGVTVHSSKDWVQGSGLPVQLPEGCMTLLHAVKPRPRPVWQGLRLCHAVRPRKLECLDVQGFVSYQEQLRPLCGGVPRRLPAWGLKWLGGRLVRATGCSIVLRKYLLQFWV
jgi:hypothetical protein